eukprot:1540224-Pyramimonas_sp.AAC.1
MAKALQSAGLGADPAAAQLASQLGALAAAKKPAAAPKPAYSVLKAATAECSRKQDALDRAARAVESAKLQLEKATAVWEKATDEMVEAECARLQAQELVDTSSDKPDGITFKVDPSLFAELDELEESDRKALEMFQKQLEEISKQASEKQKEFQQLLDQAKNAHKEAATKRRRRDEDGCAVRGEGDGGGAPSAAAAGPGGASAAASQGSKASPAVSEAVRKDMRAKFQDNS